MPYLNAKPRQILLLGTYAWTEKGGQRMKKQSELSRLMEYAGNYRFLTYLSWILSAVSALLALVPFWYLWRIIHDILAVAPDYGKAENVIPYGF